MLLALSHCRGWGWEGHPPPRPWPWHQGLSPEAAQGCRALRQDRGQELDPPSASLLKGVHSVFSAQEALWPWPQRREDMQGMCPPRAAVLGASIAPGVSEVHLSVLESWGACWSGQGQGNSLMLCSKSHGNSIQKISRLRKQGERTQEPPGCGTC